jgi:hypothetical protein
MARQRQRVGHTEDWEQLKLLVKWPEQESYEEIRPLVLFGDPVPERSEETGTSERTLYRRVEFSWYAFSDYVTFCRSPMVYLLSSMSLA